MNHVIDLSIFLSTTVYAKKCTCYHMGPSQSYIDESFKITSADTSNLRVDISMFILRRKK